MWQQLVKIVESVPDWPQEAKLKIWREKRGRRRRVVVARPTATGEEMARRVARGGRRTAPLPVQEGHQIRFRTGTFRNGLFVDAETPGWRDIGQEVPRAER